jgi:hypothetical protein
VRRRDCGQTSPAVPRHQVRAVDALHLDDDVLQVCEGLEHRTRGITVGQLSCFSRPPYCSHLLKGTTRFVYNILFQLNCGASRRLSEPLAFDLPGATPGIVTVAQLTTERRLRVGICTVKKEGDVLGAVVAFMTFEARAQDAAKALGVKELELLGIALNNPKLQAALERGGFTPTTIAAPEELGGGIVNAISRVEPVDQPEERIT